MGIMVSCTGTKECASGVRIADTAQYDLMRAMTQVDAGASIHSLASSASSSLPFARTPDGHSHGK